MTETDPTEPIQPPEQQPDRAASYWAAPVSASSVERPRDPRRDRLIAALAWITAIALAVFNAALAGRRTTFAPGTPGWFGYVVGAFLLPFVVALVLRAAYVLIARRRGGSRSFLRSGALPLAVMVLAGAGIGGNIAALAPPRAVAPADAIRISGPFTLRAASADTQQIAAAGFKNDKTIRAYEVREVVGDDGSLSLLVVVDGSLREGVGAIEQVGRGIESASGLTATYETIRDRRVAIAVGDTLSIGAWIEEPLGVYVYAVTPTRLHQIIEGILDAPRAAS